MSNTTENTTDPAVLYDALDKQGKRLRAALADADHLRAILRALLPYVIGPEDEDSPGYSHAVSEAINAANETGRVRV